MASISTRSCHKDRHKIMQRPLERISSGSLEDLLAGTQILYESYFVREFTGKMPRPKMESHTLCDNSQWQRAWTWRVLLRVNIQEKCHAPRLSTTLCARGFTRKMPQPRFGTQVLCKNSRWKRAWTYHKSHFLREFTGKIAQLNPRPRWSPLIKHRPLL